MNTAVEFVIALVVAAGAVWFTLQPIVRPAAAGWGWGGGLGGGGDAGDAEDPDEDTSPRAVALRALREIEFDRATGKLAEEDYVRLKARYESDAIAAIRAEEQSAREEARPASDRAEEAIRRARQGSSRTCPTCGPRPESNAVYCSQCGRSLVAAPGAARCRVCGAALAQGAKFCPECGGAIAA